MSTKGFSWKGDYLLTYGEIGGAATKLESAEEGAAFMKAYQEVNVHAYENIGYLMGYYDSDTRARVEEYCGTSHPLIGRSNPTPDETFEIGKRWMEGVIRGE